MTTPSMIPRQMITSLLLAALVLLPSMVFAQSSLKESAKESATKESVKDAAKDSANAPGILMMSKKREKKEAKSEIPGYRYLFGVYGGGNYNFHSAAFSKVQGISVNDFDQFAFSNITSFGASGGLVFDCYFANFLYGHLRADATWLPAEFSQRFQSGFAVVEPGQGSAANSHTSSVPTFLQNSFVASFVNVGLQPGVSVRLFGNLWFDLGAEMSLPVLTNYQQFDTLFTTPGTDRTFKDGTRGVFYGSGAISAATALRLAVYGGLAYYIPIGLSTFLVPYARFYYPFTDVATTQNNVTGAAGSWRVNTVQAGLMFKWGFSPLNKIIGDTQFERDTSIVLVDNLQKERIRLVNSQSGTVTGEENGLVIERTIVHESYVREVPKNQAIRVAVQVTGLSKDGKRQPNPTVVIEEFEAETWHPLLPQLFFLENNSDLTQVRQHLLPNPKAAQKWQEQNIPNNVLSVHAELLNVIGSRMKRNPDARLTLVGCNSNTGRENANVELSMRRAKALQTYLVNIWGIRADQIRLQARNLPEKPASSEVQDGVQENRRVEIYASTPDILSPVINRDVLRVVSPPTLEIKPLVQTPLGVTHWSMAIRQNGALLQEYLGSSDVPNVKLWDISDSLIKGEEIPLDIGLAVTDAENNRAAIEQSVTVQQITIKKKRSEMRKDKRIERYSLVMFDFNQAEIGEQNLALVEAIRPNIKPNSSVIIAGYGDRVGSKEYNRDLALRRCLEVQRLLGVPDSRSMLQALGNDVLLHDNDMPEGRAYSRIVEITIETPIR